MEQTRRKFIAGLPASVTPAAPADAFEIELREGLEKVLHHRRIALVRGSSASKQEIRDLFKAITYIMAAVINIPSDSGVLDSPKK